MSISEQTHDGNAYVAFSTDECRCPACQLSVVEASPTAPVDLWCSPDAELGCDRDGTARCPTCPLTRYESEAPLLVPSTSRRILAFTGLAGSGKSTAALRLVNAHGFTRVRFAGPLKAMMAALGLTHEQIEGSEKEQPCALLGGKTPRYAMQTIGTEWGRDIIASDLWIRAWRAALDKVPAGVPVVVDDCRFPNEADAVHAAGGVIVRIERDGAGQGASGHSSEGYRVETGAVLQNNGSVSDFLGLIDDLITPA